MIDPAVEAANRAWMGHTHPLAQDIAEQGAREALAPLRDLHRPYDRRTSLWAVAGDRHTVVCNHCLGPIDWPCATAKLIYREDEL